MTNWPCILGEDFLGLVMYISGEGLTDRAFGGEGDLT